jgi:hypothetical protein
LTLWLIASVFAQRPDEGGLFSFSSSDVLAHHDSTSFRIHYSIEGPNQTRLTDDDENGIPDFVEEVALTAEDVLFVYEETGFRRPLQESDIGMELGGSPAFDFYLVDFNGSSDGMFGIDGCIDHRCAGYMVMENDFAGYGYNSLSKAISVLVSHEFFHAIQAAYRAEQETWLSEGMAVWAEHIFEPETRDYISFSSAYLGDTERSINRPPAGAISAFSYGTALWFGFLQEKLGEGAVIAILEALDTEEDSSQAMFDVLGEDLLTLWNEFARWNLATSRRSGGLSSYPYADQLYGLSFAQEGTKIEDDHRFYPLAASYFILNHDGGTLNFLIEEGGEGLLFSLHPTDEQVALSALETWSGEEFRTWELDAGQYFLVGSFADRGRDSQKKFFCLGVDCTQEEEEAEDEEEIEVKSGCGGEKAYFLVGLLFLFHRFGGIPKESSQSCG